MTNTQPPTRIGLLLFPEWQALDVFGPLEALNTLARTHVPKITLSLISTTLSAVPSMPKGSSISQSILPTHTYATAPDLDVLLVPGGFGIYDAAATAPAVSFIKSRFDSLAALITICTGAGLAARAGVLDGHTATTNKNLWASITALGPETYWIGHARWVISEKIWTTAGPGAGFDGVCAWIASVWGDAVALDVCNCMEYRRTVESEDDPFAVVYQVRDVRPVTWKGLVAVNGMSGVVGVDEAVQLQGYASMG